MLRRGTARLERKFAEGLLDLGLRQHHGDLALHAIDDLLGQLRRPEQPAPGRDRHRRETGLRQGRRVRQERVAVRQQRRQRAQFAVLHVRHREAGRGDGEIHSPGDQVQRQRAVALVGDVNHVQLLLRDELRGGEDAGGVAGAVIQLARIGARVGDQVADRVHRQAGVREHEEAEDADQRDRREVVHRVVGRNLLRRRRVGHPGCRAVVQRVAVRIGLAHRLRGDNALRARARFDDHRLAKLLGERLREDARAEFGRAAGRERHDQADGLVRVLGERRRTAQRRKESCKCPDHGASAIRAGCRWTSGSRGRPRAAPW